MNAFQILDANNEPISLITLDELAAAYWNQIIDSKKYAQPENAKLGNWYDSIGWAIANQYRIFEYGLNNWNAVKQYMFDCRTGPIITMSPEEAGVYCCEIMINCKPYFDLIDHWKSLGYKPKQIKD